MRTEQEQGQEAWALTEEGVPAGGLMTDRTLRPPNSASRAGPSADGSVSSWVSEAEGERS